MLHVDDLIKTGSEQILLSRLAPFIWSGHPSAPICRDRCSESCLGLQRNRNLISQENSSKTCRFLRYRLLPRTKSPRNINRFRILHGRLDEDVLENNT
ncbi:hypothetical protein IE4872_PC00385 (plasmid) [Rhizobium gallicum]|uniref:Uncharacterized protein n=1 Tax=Rhizobium gallicum TaxID=56730 RepID=A0A1L5NR99_9HYPH|nr:hypothetical protein IE4872_PC00385 [Rhizobium gallicum]